MKIEEFLESLPDGIVSGEDVNLSAKPLGEIFKLVGLGSNDVFYHLGCGDEQGVLIAAREFNVKKAVGIDNNCQKIKNAARLVDKDLPVTFLCKDVRDSDISDATVVLFWFVEDEIIEPMMKKFESLRSGTRIVTIWGPLPECLPHKAKFPYIINQIPFTRAANLQEQLLSVFGVKCIDFVTAWEFAERYTKSISGGQIRNDRFLTIIQTLMIWINARNLGVACGDEIPESIQTYTSIMHEHFGIDFGHLLQK